MERVEQAKDYMIISWVCVGIFCISVLFASFSGRADKAEVFLKNKVDYAYTESRPENTNKYEVIELKAESGRSFTIFKLPE